MKKLAFLFFLVALAAGRAPATTAYEALGVIKQNRGEAILKQLIQVRGETGQPQPQSWTILMNDPAARAGIREFIVTGADITSERTPLRGYAAEGRLPALDFARLNLDSDGAFKLANQQANRLKIGFHTVEYTLRTNDADGGPLWVLHLFDHMGAPVGTMQVSAESGKIVRGLQLDPDAREKPAVVTVPPGPAPAPVVETTVTTTDDDDENIPTHFKGGVFGFVEKTSKKVGRVVKRGTLNAVGTVQETFTGERTVGTDD